MKFDSLYNKVTQEYYSLTSEKRKLIGERDRISAKLDCIENILTDLNDILCKHGNHIYEHFEAKDLQTESEEE